MPSSRPLSPSPFEPLRTPTSLYRVQLSRRVHEPAPRKPVSNEEDEREIARIHSALSGRDAAEAWINMPAANDNAWSEQPAAASFQKELKTVNAQIASLEKKLARYGDDVYDLTHDLEQPKPSLRERARRFLLRSTGAAPDPGSFDDLLAQWKSLDARRETLQQDLEAATQANAKHAA